MMKLVEALRGDGHGLGGDYLPLYGPEVLRCDPATGHPSSLAFFPSFAELRSPEAYVALVKDAELWADEVNAAIVSEGRLIADLMLGHVRERRDHWFFRAEGLRATEFGGSLAPVTIWPLWARSYYHWMFEVLPRFHLLLESGWPVDAFALHPLSEGFQRETLALIGVREEELLELHEPVRIQAERLVITPELPSRVPTWACTFLRRLLLRAEPGTGPTRIYVSRETASRGRKVENDVEVVHALQDRGFRKVVLEGLSVLEQAETFAAADFVIAPHGSGLTNLVFCRPGTTVIEMFSPSYVHPLYWMLSNRVSLAYSFLVGSGEGPAAWDEWPRSGGVDPMTINIGQLVALIESLDSRRDVG
jgi:Glycosyltransferase 61